MKEHASHPGRSAEFLSRLHDGELTAAERAHFESHRAHCAECRHAAADFEAALSLYRSSGSAPAAPDLAARILRKLQASSPRRRPFGVLFGIDLKWAGSFAAALIAVIIGFSIVLRREVPVPSAARDTAIPVVLEEKKVKENPVPRRAPPAATVDSLDVPAPVSKKGPPAPAPPAARNAALDFDSATLPSKTSAEKALQASSADAKPQAPSPSEALAFKSAVVAPPAGERARGEGAVAGSTVSGEIPPLRLVILPADTGGSVPALLPGASLEPLAAERGRVFLLIVETQGRVREVRRADTDKSLRVRVGAADGKLPPADLRVLLDLRFAPGDRPRRLLVRVE
ncbi:MAG: anti-sigma factor family protein [Thermoanaerobaculia bacterium]